MTFTHLNESNQAYMVDVSDKQITKRKAVASGRVVMLPETLAMIVSGEHHKGDVFGVARIAGIQAAKKCADLIPLCHPLMLSKVSVELTPDAQSNSVVVEATCVISGTTGVEMEALTAVSVACLTLYDMCKAVDKGMQITDVQLQQKHGGKSGSWVR